MTRLIVLLLATVLAVTFVSAASIDHDGEPGCKEQEEILTQKYRNNWDPTKYWLCSDLGQPATLEPCESETLFLTSAGKCVAIEEWAWTEPIEPPSRP